MKRICALACLLLMPAAAQAGDWTDSYGVWPHEHQALDYDGKDYDGITPLPPRAQVLETADHLPPPRYETLAMPAKAPSLQPVAYRWTWDGFYIGGDVGGIWTRNDWTFAGTDALSQTELAQGIAPPGATFNKSGFFGGGFIGANVQFAHLVVGLEGEGNLASLTSSSGFSAAQSTCALSLNLAGIFGTLSTPQCGGTTTYGLTEQMKAYAAMRLRVGVAIDNWLPYIAGGGSLGHFVAAVNGTCTSAIPGFACPGMTGGFDRWLLGWNIGGGIEWRAWQSNVILRAEGFYTKFGGQTFDIIPSQAITTGFQVTTGQASAWVFRGGVSYLFPPS
jgi:outer membrane immunogenic protein